MESLELGEEDLYCINHKAKRLQTRKQLILNRIIKNTINYNTYKTKNSKLKFSRLNQLLKANSLYDNLVNDMNRNLLNKMPYLLFGTVESIFVDEEKSEKTKVYGCAILIDSSIILLPAKNLIFDNSSFETGENEEKKNEKDEKKEKEEKYNFKLFEVEFKPLNISPEYRSYLPKSIKVIDHYTPLNNQESDYSNENNKNNESNEKSDEDKLLNSWGLAFLEYPIGDVINYIYSCNNAFPSYLKGMKQKKLNDPFDENNKIMNDIFIKNLTNDELEKSDIHFLECFPRNNNNNLTTMNNTENQQTQSLQGSNNLNNNNNNTNEDIEVTSLYDFYESYYNMNFDTKLIYLKNPYQDLKFEEDILPGFIIGEYMKKYYLLGMNTNTMIKFSMDEEENNNNENKNNENNENNDNKKDENNNNENIEKESPIYHIAIRFTKELCDEINKKIIEFNEHYPNNINFNCKVFDKLNKKIKSKEILYGLLKNNCENLYKLLNEIKEDSSLSNSDKKSLDIEFGLNMKFLQFSLMMLFNKFSSSIIESKIIDMENMKIGYFPGSSILSEIIQSKDSIMTINLKNNELYSNGIKEIMLPIFNKKKILDLGKDLKCLCLDFNKLDGKSLKYIRYLIKVSPQLALINLSSNYIKGSSLRHLIHCTREKEFLEILYLNNNMLGNECGEYLNQILRNLINLRELNLSCNCLGDATMPQILNILKENNKIETLYLGSNDIGPNSSEYIANFLSNNQSLKILWLNNNPLGSNGIKLISQALSTKLILEEINLNSTQAGDEGGKELFENIKMNKYLKRLYFNCNRLEKNSMEKLGEMMKMDNDDEKSEGGIELLSLSGNLINDECINYFVEELMRYRWLRELKLNSNFISDDGGELILYAVLQNMNITKVNLENNQTTWEVNNENFKTFRDDIQIYF